MLQVFRHSRPFLVNKSDVVTFVRMKKTTIALAALAMIAPLALAACGSGDGRETVTISFNSKFNERTVMVMNEEGSVLGNYIPGNGDMMDESGNVMGQFDVNSVVTRTMDDAEGRLVTAEYSFGTDGADSFIIMGAEHFAAEGGLPVEGRQLNYAVVGGTGKYKGANGECDVHREGEVFTTECSFTVDAN